MISTVVEKELHQQLENMPLGQQRQVLDFARALASSHPRGMAGEKLLQFKGSISRDDLKEISKSIAEDCENVDSHEW